MKLRKRLLISIISLILLTGLIVTVALRHAYSDSFSSYLKENQNARLQGIIADIEDIVKKESLNLSGGSLNEQLQIYAKDTNINLTVMDNESNIIALYRGLDPNPDGSIQIDEYNLLNSEGLKVGSMLVTYDQTNPALIKSLKDFRQRSFGSIILGLGVFAGLAIIFSFYLSKQITDPIEVLSQATGKIRRKEFDVDLKDSDIFEIQNLVSNIQFLASSLERQEESRKAYAQDISHELRTPLTNIRLHLEAIKDGVIDADKKNILILENNTLQLMSLVDKLKESFNRVSLISSENIEKINISELTNLSLDAFEASFRQKNASLLRSIDDDIYINTDRQLYEQILSNLMSNALKAIDMEGQVQVTLNCKHDNLVLSVADNGVGMSRENLDHIFDRFYRVESSRNSRIGGQGLGLSITRNIIRQLNGKIEVNSKKGKGSRFQVILPINFFKEKN